MRGHDFKKIKNELDGLTRHFKIRPASQQFARDPNPDYNFPFRKDEESAFCIRNSIPIWADAESNAISAIILYDIRPEARTLIYCHTAPLKTYDKDYGCDYFDVPFEIITSMMPTIQQQIILSVQAAMKKPGLHEDYIELMGDIAEGIAQSSSADFAVDIYIPPVISPYTGERYFRPGHQYAYYFDNPLMDVDFAPTKKFLQYLHKAVTVELPAHGLKPQYDIHVEMTKKFGTASHGNQQPEDRRSLRDTRENTQIVGTDRKKFTYQGMRIGANRR